MQNLQNREILFKINWFIFEPEIFAIDVLYLFCNQFINVFKLFKIFDYSTIQNSRNTISYKSIKNLK